MLNWRDPENPRAGGAERVTQAYLRELVERGHEVIWYTCGFPNCREHTELDGVQIVRGPSSTLGSRVAARQWASGEEPFDLVVDQHHGLPWFAHWWNRRRTLSYIHEALGPIWSAFYPWPLNRIGMGLEFATHRLFRNQLFWTGCEATKQQLRDRGVKQVKVVSYGVDTEVLDPLPNKTVESVLRLLVVCRLAPNKRVAHAIDALSTLRNRGRSAELRIVGGGDDEPSLKAQVKALELEGSVFFLGRLSEARKLEEMRDSHFLLHTSVREGWGLNVVEANAMGTPAIVYPVAGLTESTLHDRTGWVVDEETPESLAEGIVVSASNDVRYQRWRSAGRDRAKALHWNNIAPRAARWLESLADGAPFETETLGP